MTTNPDVLRLAREIAAESTIIMDDGSQRAHNRAAEILAGKCDNESLALHAAIAAIERTTELAARHLAVRHGLEMDGTEGGENDEPCLDFVTLQNYDHLRQPEKGSTDE